MEDKERREEEDFSLDDILKEFGKPRDPDEEDAAVEFAEEFSEDLAEEIPEETAAEEIPEMERFEELPEEEDEAALDLDAALAGDTVRLDAPELLKGIVHDAQPIDDEDEQEAVVPVSEEKPAFTEGWEPEYEQPMGEYVPPQPIAFPTRAESREMKRKLVIGPEKKYYELTEKGLGKLQIGMFFCLLVVILSAVSTVAYAQGMIPDNRIRLMIFSQFLAVLVSAFLGSFQLIQGVDFFIVPTAG